MREVGTKQHGSASIEYRFVLSRGSETESHPRRITRTRLAFHY